MGVFFRHSNVCTAGIVARMFNGLGDRFRSLRLGDNVGSGLLQRCGTLRSFESASVVTMFGSWELAGDMVIVSLVRVPDNSVELKIFGVLYLGGLALPATVPHRKRLNR